MSFFFILHYLKPKCRILSVCLLTGLIPFLLSNSVQMADGFSQTDQGDTLLLFGQQPLERELATGQSHFFQIALTKGQYTRIEVAHKNVDLTLVIFSPESEHKGSQHPLIEIVSPSEKTTTKEVFLVAEKTGNYRLEVKAGKVEGVGKYEIKVVSLRPSEPADVTRTKANEFFQQAEKLIKTQKKEDLYKAIDCHKEAAKLTHELKDIEWEALSLSAIGSLYLQLGKQQDALGPNLQALAHWRTLDNNHWIGIALNNLGSVYDQLYKFKEAIECYTEGLTFCQNDGDRFTQGLILNNLGLVYSKKGEPEMALDYYKQALGVFNKLDSENVNVWRGKGNANDNIGNLHSNFGEMQAALDAYQEALSCGEKSHNLSNQSTALNNIGQTYEALGETENAIKYYKKAIGLAEHTGNSGIQMASYNGLGRCYRRKNDNEEAANCYQKLFEMGQKTDDQLTKAKILNIVGVDQYRQAKYNESLDNLQQSLRIYQEKKILFNQTNILDNIGLSFHRLGNRQKAGEFFNQSLKLAQNLKDRRAQIKSLDHLARLDYEAGDLIEARNKMESVLSLAEKTRLEVTDIDLRTTFFATIKRYYDFYIHILMQLHKMDEKQGYNLLALQTSERATARGLLQLINEAKIDFREKSEALLSDQERQLQKDIDAKFEILAKLKGGSHAQENVVLERCKVLEDEINTATEKQKRVLNEIRHKNPEYAKLADPQPLNIAEIQQLLDQDTVLLKYTLGNDRSYLWKVTRNSVLSFALAPRPEIDSATTEFIRELEEGDKKKIDKTAQKLSDLIWPAHFQPNEKRLIIISDGALNRLPFNILPDPQNKNSSDLSPLDFFSFVPLIAKYEIVTLPSASVLTGLRLLGKARRIPPKEIAIFGDPVFSMPVQKSKILPERRASTPTPLGTMIFTPLPATREEANSIFNLFTSKLSLRKLDFGCNRDFVVTGNLGEYRYLHFATHTLFDDNQPYQTALVFSLFNSQGDPQNGYLRLRDIFALKLNADFVVLSACNTGIGKLVDGEGMIGLVRGFMFAGAQRLVVSLWSVPSPATCELMKRFYKELKSTSSNGSPAKALHDAQLSMWKEKGKWTPIDWAGFIVQGDWK